MSNFTDAAGREWQINLTLGAVDRLQAAVGVDLAADDQSPLVALLFDRRKLANVLWQLITPGEVTREQFNEALNGDALGAGWDALEAAVVDFAPLPNRAAVASAIAAQKRLIASGIDALIELSSGEAMDQAVKIQVDQLRAELLAAAQK